MSNLEVKNEAWLDQDKVDLLRKTYSNKLNDKQFELFCHVAKSMSLDPIKKEIYGMIVGGKLVTIVGIDGFRKTAHETGEYMGMEPIKIEKDEDGKILSASCTVYKRVHGEKCAFHAEVLFKEYTKGSGNWKSMPQTMISKVAEAHALRRGFPALSNIYTPEEMDQAGANFKTDNTRNLTDRFKQLDDVKVPEYIELEPEIEIELEPEEKPKEVKNGKQSNNSGPIRKAARTKKSTKRKQRS